MRSGLFAGLMLGAATGSAKPWDRRYVKSLSDGAFACVETDAKGRKHRHLPHHDVYGHVEPSKLKAAIARWKQVKWVDPAHARGALEHLRMHERDLCAQGRLKCGGAGRPG